MNADDPLDKKYDKQFMQKEHSLAKGHCEWAGNMVKSIMSHMNPSTVLDLGCGGCNFSNMFNDSGCDVTAVDGSKHAADTANKGVDFILHDLTEALSLGKKFDLVLCVEVIEHLEEAYENALLKTIVSHADDWVVFTGAKPGQGGKGHVNCKELEYWEGKLEDRGVVVDHELTRAIQKEWRSRKVRWWYVEGLIIGRGKHE